MALNKELSFANSLLRSGEFFRSVQRSAQTGQGSGWKSVERFPGSPGLPSASVVRTLFNNKELPLSV